MGSERGILWNVRLLSYPSSLVCSLLPALLVESSLSLCFARPLYHHLPAHTILSPPPLVVHAVTIPSSDLSFTPDKKPTRVPMYLPLDLNELKFLANL